MGRSSRQQAEQNRADILKAACRLFREHGVDNVSIADVMAAVGLTAGGFYRHFASKEALVNEVLSAVFSQSKERWQQTLQAGEQQEHDSLDTLIRNYFRKKQPGQTCPILAFAPHVCHQEPESQTMDLYGAHTEQLYRHFRDIALLSDKADAGPAPSEEQILVLFAAMIGTGFLAQSINDSAWIRTLKEAVLASVATRHNEPV